MNAMLKGYEMNILPRQEANFRENAEVEILTEFALTDQHFTFIMCSDCTLKYFSYVIAKDMLRLPCFI